MKIEEVWKKWNMFSMLFLIVMISMGCREVKKGVESTDQESASEGLGDLLGNLEVVAVESDMWLLSFKSVLGQRYQFDLHHKPFEGPTETNRIPASKAISVGDTFFKELPGQARFRLRNIEVRDEAGPTGTLSRDWAIIEDLSEQKKGKTYELAQNIKQAERANSI